MINFYRSLPNFKGKHKLGSILFPFPATNSEQECLETVNMRDGSKLLIDLRCPTERITYFTGQYDHSIIYHLLKVLKTESTILDVGANIGFYTVAFGHYSRKALQNYTIHSFEPVKANVERLYHNVKLNRLQEHNMYIHNTALGNQEGKITLQVGIPAELSSTNNAMWIQGELEKGRGLSCSAEITKLDIFAQKNQLEACDLIKVDIEGAELEFFLGGRDVIKKYRPIILSEFNAYCANQFGYSFKEILNLASSWQYDLYQQKGKDKFVHINKPLVNLSNFLMIPKETSENNLCKLGVILKN